VNPNEARFSPSFFTSVPPPALHATAVATDGLIYAQPLYIKALHGSGNGPVGSCPAGSNVVIVATENDSIYAFNAGSAGTGGGGATCWYHRFTTGAFPEGPIPWTQLPNGTNGPCDNLLPQVGITGTPVIEASVTPPVMYVVDSHYITLGSGTQYRQYLHAVDTTTGVEITAARDLGAALDSESFDVLAQLQRAALVLSNPSTGVANVYVSWASYCDFPDSGTGTPYEGWIAGFQLNYSALSSGYTTLGPFRTEPLGSPAPGVPPYEGGIWMAGSGPAIDGGGNVYVSVGNGDVVPETRASNLQTQWGDSVLKLGAGLGSGNPLDFYTPNDYAQLQSGSGSLDVCFEPAPPCPTNFSIPLVHDTDMGTGGVVLLPSASELGFRRQARRRVRHPV
jgi:hypothetical protein